MTAITIANTDYEIIEDVQDALIAATVSAVALFDSVTMAMTRQQVDETRFKGAGPNCSILYNTTVEDSPSPEEQVGLFVRVTLILARKESISGADQKVRVENLLKIVNGTKNAVHAGTLTDAAGWADGDYVHRKIEWGDPTLTVAAEGQWSAAEMSLEVSYVITDSVSH